MTEPESIARRISSFNRPLSAEELAPLLGITRLTLLKWARAKYIPSIRMKNMVKFDPGNTVRWLLAHGGQMLRKKARRQRQFVGLQSEKSPPT